MNKSLLFLTLILPFFSCSDGRQDWEDEWEEHSNDFKKVVQLYKENKLQRRTDGLYKIPDSINLNYQPEKYVFIHKDTVTDESFTLSFYLDSTIEPNNNNIIVYTDNNRIVEFYRNPPFPVTKIEEHWYFVYYKATY